MSLTAQLERIRANAAAIEKLPEETVSHIFGRAKHKFRLNPVTTEDRVIEFETKYNFRFPEGYREFILKVGDGGAGPFYGLKQRFVTYGATLRAEEAKYYRLPSIYTRSVAPHGDWKRELLGADWSQQEEEDESGTLYLKGNIVIAEVGCGAELVLVANGPLCDSVIHTDFGYSPPYVWQPASFLDFYEAWQIAVISEKRGTGFGF